MAHFVCSIAPPPKSSIARSKSVPSFITSNYVVSKMQDRAPFDITLNDISNFELYPRYHDTRTVSEYLHQSNDSMLVLFPAQERLERSIRDLSTRLQQLEARGKETQRLLLESNEVRV